MRCSLFNRRCLHRSRGCVCKCMYTTCGKFGLTYKNLLCVQNIGLFRYKIYIVSFYVINFMKSNHFSLIFGGVRSLVGEI